MHVPQSGYNFELTLQNRFIVEGKRYLYIYGHTEGDWGGGKGWGRGGGGDSGRTKKDNKQHANLRPPEQYKANARRPSFKGPVSIKTKTNKQKTFMENSQHRVILGR